ncbi:hypothetical protein MYAER_1699 [Microcystis aeruginosa NIES-2549]|uniref:Uncharacterized protein n=1 Tax=Microcystis aeruginosa NIES-2549 TaxID=1641812 RepID=A0A0F6U3S9_MICAE|nr:hypothetical protein MYAER_1699 [Microcystis aeruginosa NIES-2549]AOC52440.1 hypothetical protein amyaer_1715 [Microcystis aeruginosa NIES-2481]
MISYRLSAFFSLLPSPISPHPTPHTPHPTPHTPHPTTPHPTPHTPHPTPHTPIPAFKQVLTLLAQTGQKMIASDIGIIWLRKKMSSLAACWPKNISKY